MTKYIIKISNKRKSQLNSINLSQNDNGNEAIRLFKQLYKLTNDKRQYWDYEMISCLSLQK